MAIDPDELYIVNYCHKNCVPLKNIIRLPKEEAFPLAYEMAEQNTGGTAFWRFKDFENYYPRRMKTDKCLHDSFIALGGNPKTEHPLSFVLQGNEYLNHWFDHGIITKCPLNHISSQYISFYNYIEVQLWNDACCT